MRKPCLTIIITFYKGNLIYEDYWDKVKDELYDKGIDIIFTYDGTKEEIEPKIQGNHYFSGGKGKVETIYNLLKTGIVTTEFFKVIDPDDIILFEFLDKVVEDIQNNENKDIGIISMPNYRVRQSRGKFNHFIRMKFKHMGNAEVVDINNFGTSWTILSTKSFLIDNFYERGILNKLIMLEDQILGLISFINNPKIVKINFNFILYFFESGVSNKFQYKDFVDCIVSIYTYYKLIETSGIKPAIGFPGDLQYIFNKLDESYNDNKITNEQYSKFRITLEMLKFPNIIKEYSDYDIKHNGKNHIEVTKIDFSKIDKEIDFFRKEFYSK